MALSNAKAVLRNYSEVFKNRKAEGATTELYTQFYRDFEKAGLLDSRYGDRVQDNTLSEAISRVETMTYSECLTWLTFILRAQRWTDGWFEECTENGSIYKLLSRALEVS